MSFKTELKAFGLEPEEDFNLVFNVKDIAGDSVAGAAVSITSGTHSESGRTDEDGCYKGQALPNTESSMHITATGYQGCTINFRIVPKASLSDPDNNFVCFAKYGGSYVSGASVTLTPEPTGSAITGSTDSNGMFDALLDHDTKLYALYIVSGGHDYDEGLCPFIKISCGSDDYAVASILVLT